MMEQYNENYYNFEPREAEISTSSDNDEHGDGPRAKHCKRKSRDELNEIEKQRTRKINSEINLLSSILDDNLIKTKRDKCSVLQGIRDYIQQLQSIIVQGDSRVHALKVAHEQEV